MAFLNYVKLFQQHEWVDFSDAPAAPTYHTLHPPPLLPNLRTLWMFYRRVNALARRVGGLNKHYTK